MKVLYFVLSLHIIFPCLLAAQPPQDETDVRQMVTTFLRLRDARSLQMSFEKNAIIQWPDETRDGRRNVVIFREDSSTFSVRCLGFRSHFSTYKIRSVKFDDRNNAKVDLQLFFNQSKIGYFDSPDLRVSIHLLKSEVKVPLVGLSTYWRIYMISVSRLYSATGEPVNCLSDEEISARAEESAEVKEIDAKVNDLKSILEGAKSELAKSKQSLVEAEVNNYQNLKQVGYFSDEVTRKIEFARDQMMKFLEGDEFAALRNHISTFYPEAQLSFLGVKSGRAVVTPKSVNDSYARSTEYITGLEVMVAARTMDLNILVNGGERAFAIFKIWAGNPEKPKPDVTISGDILNLPRGLYHYRITKTGFKDIYGELDLIRDSRNTLNCLLKEQADRGDSLPCSRQ